jgi:hypothetical protein
MRKGPRERAANPPIEQRKSHDSFISSIFNALLEPCRFPQPRCDQAIHRILPRVARLLRAALPEPRVQYEPPEPLEPEPEALKLAPSSVNVLRNRGRRRTSAAAS